MSETTVKNKLPPYHKGNLATFAESIKVKDPKDPTKEVPLLTLQEADHIRRHWFNDPNGDGSNDLNGPGWWRGDLQPIEPLIRHGLITAIEVAVREPGAAVDRNPPLPIVFYWMCHAGHPYHPTPNPEDVAEVAVTWSDFQVTVVIHTPDPGTDDPLTGTEPIYRSPF